MGKGKEKSPCGVTAKAVKADCDFPQSKKNVIKVVLKYDSKLLRLDFR